MLYFVSLANFTDGKKCYTVDTVGKEKQYICKQSVDSVLQKFDACEGQLMIPYLSLIMDLKMKGLLGSKQDIYECIQLCVQLLTRKLCFRSIVYVT